MLQALLHGKLDPALPEPQRLEDALTSTVFGALAHLEAWSLLVEWLELSSTSSEAGASAEYWFWPRLAGAVQPDVVLRIGNVLVVVEAKYRSGRHDLSLDDPEDERPVDQIVRQHKAVSPPHEARVPYPHSLEQAVRSCRIVQAFVVDARRMRTARREYAESRALLPQDAELHLVTWQGLHGLLKQGNATGDPWALDLSRYLALCGLASFSGVPHTLPAAGTLQAICDWRASSPGGTLSGLRAAGALLAEPTISRLVSWRSAAAGTPR